MVPDNNITNNAMEAWNDAFSSSDDSSDESDEEPALKKPKEFLVFAFSSEDFGLYCISYSIPGFIFW